MDVVPRDSRGERCPIVDTWWQAETGGIMMSPLPGCIPTKPGSCRYRCRSLSEIVDASGQPVEQGEGGWLVMAKPWPGMLRGIWGDEERFVETYWERVPGKYLAGDNARQDEDIYFWIMGRIDDVLNVAGHRLSTIEIESALVGHPAVAEAAAVGRPHDVKGEAVSVFVTLESGEPDEALKKELRQHVRRQIARLPHLMTFTFLHHSLRHVAARSCEGFFEISLLVAKQLVITLEDYAVLANLRSMKSKSFARLLSTWSVLGYFHILIVEAKHGTREKKSYNLEV